jgi:hypothetical protein
MATDFWDIEDASDEPMPTEYGGTVDLSCLEQIQATGWQVEQPDSNIALEPVFGGEVKEEASAKEVEGASSDRTFGTLKGGLKFNQTIILIVLVVLCVAFLGVVARGVLYGTLDFQAFTSFVLALLAAVGINAVTGGKGGGSG